MGATTKIDWADSTWSPVTGCFKNCEYCYAMNMVRRFGSSAMFTEAYIREIEMPELLTPVYSYTKSGSAIRNPYPHGFIPTLHRYLFDKPQRWKKSRTVFACSMADLFGGWIPDEWIEQVFQACAAAPQHRYMFLTKNPVRYNHLHDKGLLLDGKNYWYGSSVFKDQLFKVSLGHNVFLSVEPIMEDVSTNLFDNPIYYQHWVIVGSMTGPLAGKYPVKREWIENLADDCKMRNIPIFMKESLRGIMNEELIQQFPW